MRTLAVGIVAKVGVVLNQDNNQFFIIIFECTLSVGSLALFKGLRLFL